MPSPFPGMDPYLEHAGLWPDVHHRLISLISDEIAGQVRPRYYVRIEERVYLSDEFTPGRRVIVPDVHVTAGSAAGRPLSPRDGGGVAVAEPIGVTVEFRGEIREPRLEIIDREGHRVVTVIEILSPANKAYKGRGRTSFEEKRDEVTDSESHWIEIDLLRDGEGFTPREVLPPHEYLALVSRAEERPRGLLWPIRLDQRLPVVPVPLRPEDPDATLDLQAVLTSAYDRAGYDLSVDYRRDPVPPLPPEWAEWSARLLAQKGLRPA